SPYYPSIVTHAASRHRVIAVPAPGVAAQYTLRGQPATLNRTVSPDRFDRVLRARRSIAAGRGQDARRADLPEPGDEDEEVLHRPFRLCAESTIIAASSAHRPCPPSHGRAPRAVRRAAARNRARPRLRGRSGHGRYRAGPRPAASRAA